MYSRSTLCSCRSSIGHRDPDDQDEPMPQSPGDVPPTPDSSRPSGLASVLKGLTNAGKLSKSPPPPGQLQSPSPSIAPPLLDSVNASSTSLRGFSPSHMESFELLRNGSPSERIAAAAALRSAIADYPLNPVLDIWYVAKDMIEPGKTSETRIAGWELLAECVKHASSTDIERKEYFETLTATTNPADFNLQLAALADLTRNGRELSGFDYEVIPLLRNWLHETYREVKQARRHVSRAAKAINKSRAQALREERNFEQLFRFVIDVVKFNSSLANEAAACGLIDCLLNICMDTTVEEDLRACIAVLNAIVTFGAIPSVRLKECVHVLSCIYNMVLPLEKDSWNTLSILCRSHNGQATVRILLDILRHSPSEGTNEKNVNREIRGALAVLRKLLQKSTEKGYPSVPYALLVNGLTTTVKVTRSVKSYAEVLKLINSLFDDGTGSIHNMIVDEDWSALLDTAAECSRRAIAPALTSDSESGSRSLHSSLKDEGEKPDEVIGYELLRLIARLEVLMGQGSKREFIPRQTLIRFFTNVYHILPDSAARAVLDHFLEFRCCSPSDLKWEYNLRLVLEAFFADRSRTSATRLRALQIIMDTYEILDLVDESGGELVPSIVRSVLADVTEEDDIRVLEGIVSLVVSVAVTADMELFDFIINTLRRIVVNDRLRSPISPSSTSSPGTPTPLDRAGSKSAQTPSNVVTKGYVKLLVRLMNFSSAKSGTLYSHLVNIAKSNLCEVDARLTAMKLLFRLRGDWANRIYLTNDLDTDSLASSLYRTEASLTKKMAEDAAQPVRLSRGDLGATTRASRGISFGQGGSDRPFQYPNRTPSSAKHHSASPHKYEQLWSLPDAYALPDGVPTTASPILICHVDLPEDDAAGDEDGDKEEAVDEKRAEFVGHLDISAWLEALLNLFRNGCDWEVYSFILVHLPSQLSNHGIFKGAIKQVQNLRKTLCEQIRMNSFQEPPNASGLRRADVAICLFHSLTMILSYHEHFQKQDEDDIVRTLVHGIATWERSAKACIHALSVCCHELPLSTSKSLVQMLQKMSQIITQPHVAMHILEFLTCLSRMQDLYVNFRDDEYRIVFGIAFRYLQYVRDKKQSHRNSTVSEPTTTANALLNPMDASLHPSASDDLPQYVYALAYHVITFWFLALKLPDRASHVGWIAKNLFTDVDGAQAEEQALITMDFMQRVAYSDADESAADPLFSEERFGEIAKRRWLVGNSILTVEQASGSGWAQITKRQPSGTSSYTIRETLQPPPPHQVRNPSDIPRDGQPSSSNSILPSHVVVQLMSSMPQNADAFRPVPLPDDDMVKRAIRLFDKTSTVDGHHVGVVYMAENQTSEMDILANVSGSSDYHRFLNGLGTLVKLKGATFNTQGLDREYGSDGLYAFCWRDRVTEIVFHVTTQMPTNLEHDPQCIQKKKHIGNDFVNIIFNDSGHPFKFDTFASQFNFVNIVITPESRASFIANRERSDGRSYNPFYRVTVMSKPGFPEISPASETKMVSLKALPAFVRLLAINASVFSQVWANREGGEHISPWRARLREIKRLRDKYGPKAQGTVHHVNLSSATTPSPPPSALGGAIVHLDGSNATVRGGGGGGGGGGSVRDSFSSFRRSSVATFLTNTSEQTSHRSSVLSTNTTNDTEVINGIDSLVDSVDFSKWA